MTALVAAAIGGCGVDRDDTAQRSTVVTFGSLPDTIVEQNQAFPEQRCITNRAAGTITFLTGSGGAASASTLDVVLADAAGYFDAMCLDVVIEPGRSSSNLAEVADDRAQFASSASFTQVVEHSIVNDADLVVVTVEGRTTIDTLIVKSGEATELDELAGRTIGVQGALPPSIDVMLRTASLIDGVDFDVRQIDGDDPVADLESPGIIGVPGAKSDEVGTLERAGIGVQLFDPLDYGVPGSFGVISTSATFIAEHPTAAQDFVRASSQGLIDAVADPTAAVAATLTAMNATSTDDDLSPEVETYRWETEARLILEGAPEGLGLGTPDVGVLQAELDAYAILGLFGDGPVPDAEDFIAADLNASIHDDAGAVIWPG
ncbi:MAG: ABC transporter substrate-binding protein [Ilumatobacter sp.]